MMKNTTFILSLVFVVLLGACAPVENKAEAELRATLVAINVEQTVQVQEIGTLTSLLAQPTATCPICTPVVVTATQGEPSPTATEVQPSATPAPTNRPTGSLSGKLSYPSEIIPPLRIVAYNPVTGEYYWQNTVTNQGSYRFAELPEAGYQVLAYLIETPSDTFYAAYSNFVTCGMTEGCLDHNLITVEVNAGQETKDVNPIDWYALDPMELGWPLDPTINWD